MKGVKTITGRVHDEKYEPLVIVKEDGKRKLLGNMLENRKKYKITIEELFRCHNCMEEKGKSEMNDFFGEKYCDTCIRIIKGDLSGRVI